MLKVGMESIRKKQLIDATLAVMVEVGYHGTTISLIRNGPVCRQTL